MKGNKKKEEQVVMIKCPGCDLELPEDDLPAQIEHIETQHPEIAIKRLNDAHEFERAADLAAGRNLTSSWLPKRI